MWCTTLHQGQFHRFLFFCFVLSCYVLWCDVPPFIKVNTIDSYSFVMYCYVMYCDVIYHPSSRSIPPLLILLLCLVMLCIVRSRTTLHHSQFHQVKVIRNSEVLLPNFLWSWYIKGFSPLEARCVSSNHHKCFSTLRLLHLAEEDHALRVEKAAVWWDVRGP